MLEAARVRLGDMATPGRSFANRTLPYAVTVETRNPFDCWKNVVWFRCGEGHPRGGQVGDTKLMRAMR